MTTKESWTKEHTACDWSKQTTSPWSQHYWRWLWQIQ